MIGRQPDGSTVNVTGPVHTSNNLAFGFPEYPQGIAGNSGPLVFNIRPAWDTSLPPTPAPTLEDYKEACRKIRELAEQRVGPWSSWKTILELLPKE